MGDPLAELEFGSDGACTKSERGTRPRMRRRMSVWALMKVVAVLACSFGLIAALSRAVGSRTRGGEAISMLVPILPDPAGPAQLSLGV